MKDMLDLLESIYKDTLTETNINDFTKLLSDNKQEKLDYKLDQSDSFLITYGDTLVKENQLGFETLFNFAESKLSGIIKNIHILPMYPYTSDDGFSVVDYTKIAENLGTWEILEKYQNNFGLMYDFVINHISKESQWFKDFLDNKNNYFINRDLDFNTELVVRPRTSPLFHKYQDKEVWTTFSEDQVDLNFDDFELFLEASQILIDYCVKGATFIRLDAIGFLFKRTNTSCIHLEQTHNMIKLWQLILQETLGKKYLITETNVPHDENISYFGDSDEADLVYNFALPPLVADAILCGDSTYLQVWLSNLSAPKNTSYFNFLASHDGIGLRSVEKILPEKRVHNIVDKTLSKNGRVNYKTNVDQTQTAYECNINYNSLLKENDEFDVDRFVVANFILLSIIGVPAIYIHSLIGSENDLIGLEESNINRRINREKLDYDKLLEELDNPNSPRNKIFTCISDMLKIRKNKSSFGPYTSQKVLNYGSHVFAIERENILAIANLTNQVINLEKNLEGVDLISEKKINQKYLNPYQIIWIER